MMTVVLKTSKIERTKETIGMTMNLMTKNIAVAETDKDGSGDNDSGTRSGEELDNKVNNDKDKELDDKEIAVVEEDKDDSNDDASENNNDESNKTKAILDGGG